MPEITALAILLSIYAIGELIAKQTKATFSTVLGIAILLLVGFWTGILPQDLFERAGVDKFGKVVAGILITSLGTTIDFEELKQQWRVVLVSMLGVCGAVCIFLLGGKLLSLEKMAMAGAPVFAGGSAATLIVTETLNEKGMTEVATFCLVLYVMQKFIGVPIASICLRQEAINFRKNPENIAMYCQKTQIVANKTKRRKPLKLPEFFNKPSVYMAKLGLVTTLSYYVAGLLHGILHYYVICLLMGVLFFSLGFLEKGIMQKTQAGEMITFLVIIIIFSNLASTTPSDVLEVLIPLIILAVCGVGGVCGAGFISSKVFKISFGLAVSIGISCTFGFPTTMLMPKEVAQAIGENDQEKAAIENYLLPTMLIAGLVTVTIVSVVIAGLIVNIL